MKLTGPEIIKRVQAGSIVIDPFEEKNVNPNSVNLRLDRHLLVYQTCPTVQTARLAIDYSHNISRVFRRAQRMQQQACQGKDLKGIFCPELWDWNGVLDMKQDTPTYELDIPDRGLVLVPGRLYLGHTVEYTETHDCVPCIEGRSSIGRLGIAIHATAGFGDVGFCGTWTLEISVIEPVRIYPHVGFCQISYDTVEGEIRRYNSEKYQGQRTPKPSGLWRELQTGEKGEQDGNSVRSTKASAS